MPNPELQGRVERDVDEYIKGLRELDPNGEDDNYDGLRERLLREITEMRRAEEATRVTSSSRRVHAAS